VRNIEGVESGLIGNVESAKRALAAIIIGAAALSMVMLLILLAAWQASSSVVDSPDSSGKNAKISIPADARNLEIDYYAGRTKTGMAGLRELVVEGRMTNRGRLTVEAADLRCYFETDSGKQIHFDFPLVVDSYLDNLGESHLPPMTARNFSVRMGEFPDGIASDITRVEVINLRLKND